MDGLDEITVTTQTKITELNKGTIKTYYVQPEDFSLTKSSIEDIKGGDATENARIILDLLDGKVGPKMDILLLNAGASLYVGNKVDSIQSGIQLAKELVEQGKAKQKLDEFNPIIK